MSEQTKIFRVFPPKRQARVRENEFLMFYTQKTSVRSESMPLYSNMCLVFRCHGVYCSGVMVFSVPVSWCLKTPEKSYKTIDSCSIEKMRNKMKVSKQPIGLFAKMCIWCGYVVCLVCYGFFKILLVKYEFTLSNMKWFT